jgi:hypothetical protein
MVSVPLIRSGVAVIVSGRGVNVSVLDGIEVGEGEGEKVADGNAVDSGVLQEATRNAIGTNQKINFFIARIVMLLD